MDVLYANKKHELLDNLKKLEETPEVKSVLFFMANDEEFTPDFLNPVLQSFTKPVIGGVIYQLIFNNEQKKSGVLLIPLLFELKTEVFNYDDVQSSVFQKLENSYSNKIGEKGSIFIFTDAFTNSKSSFIENLFNFFGFRYTFFGAGCGSDSYVSFPCIIHNSGVHANSGVIGYSAEPIVFGVAHGWSSISNPLKVTESEMNKIISINWKPAFEVYKRTVEEHSGLKFNSMNFLDIAKSYPIGLIKIDGEMVVRDPFLVEDDAVYCIDNIEKGQYISILNGDTESLIDGAENALNIFNKNKLLKGIVTDFKFYIDCISRVNFLGDNYNSTFASSITT
ncbi:MAG: FIST N-terminal domain-containing protein [Paludibacter sp.]